MGNFYANFSTKSILIPPCVNYYIMSVSSSYVTEGRNVLVRCWNFHPCLGNDVLARTALCGLLIVVFDLSCNSCVAILNYTMREALFRGAYTEL